MEETPTEVTKKPVKKRSYKGRWIFLVIVLAIAGVVAIWYLFTPKVLLVTSGNNSLFKETKSFTTTNEWSVTYSYNCSINDGFGNFSYMVMSPIYKIDKSINVDESGGSDTVHYSDAGKHHLQIIATCPWHIVVKEKREL